MNLLYHTLAILVFHYYLGPEKQVSDVLFEDYINTERPVKNKSQVVMVNVRLSLNQIMDLVSNNEYLSLFELVEG